MSFARASLLFRTPRATLATLAPRTAAFALSFVQMPRRALLLHIVIVGIPFSSDRFA